MRSPGPVRGEQLQSSGPQGGRGEAQRDAGDDRQVEQAARGGPDALGVVDVDAGVGEHDGLRAGGVRRPQHRPGVAGVTDVGEHRDQARAGGQHPLQRDVDAAQTASRPCGVTVSAIAASTSAVTVRTGVPAARAAAATSACRSSASGVT